MNIIHLTNNDFDGAGKAVYSLHTSLRKLGVNSTMLVYRKKGVDDSVIQVCEGPLRPLKDFFQKGPSILPFLWAKLRWELKKIRWVPETIFNFGLAFISLNKLKKYLQKVDILCLHSVQSFLSPQLIRDIQHYSCAPIVWTTMDMEPLTGGCHFHNDCRKFEDSCGECPQLKNAFVNDISRRNWDEKKKNWDGLPIHLITASSWVQEHIERSSLFKRQPIKRIMLGVDPDIFRKGDKRQSRREWDLPQEAKIILFGCFNLDVANKRKGASYLIEALRLLQKRMENEPNAIKGRVVLATFGGNPEGFLAPELAFPWKHLGHINGEQKMASAFQAADIFACPSIDDFGPRVVIESFMCHTPVVAFNRGVARDLIQCDQDGRLVNELDAQAYAQALWECLTSENAGQKTNDQLRQMCSQEYQAKQYLSYLKDLTAQKQFQLSQ
ncbi:MAG TPA: glycosyltransferase [Candidatus Omnitrophota bacterium]|nr:glycosyltransferase [Candidatus Omnitrophota bacterium]